LLELPIFTFCDGKRLVVRWRDVIRVPVSIVVVVPEVIGPSVTIG
jgi:hypothetical protein